VKRCVTAARHAELEAMSSLSWLTFDSLGARKKGRGRRGMPSIVTTERHPGMVASLAAGAHMRSMSTGSAQPVDDLSIGWGMVTHRRMRGSRHMRFISPQDQDLMLSGSDRLVRGRRSEGHVSLAA